MSDWEMMGNQGISQAAPAQAGRDWEIVNNAYPSNQVAPEQEGIGKSIGMAVPRVATDVARGAYQFAKNIPGYFESAKTEVPGLAKVAYQHPFHALGQAAAGSQEAINQFAQLPLNIAQYGQRRLNLVPQGAVNAISSITPQDTTQAINQLFGQPQYPGESLLRGAVRNIPEISGTLAVTKPLLSATKNSIKDTILDTHDALENRATNSFEKVSDEINKRGINKVSLAPDSEINELMSNDFPIIKNNDLNVLLDNARSDWLDDMKQYFPNTRASKNLINSAKTGEYNALRKIQSDLYQNAKKNLGSSLEADRMRGSEMLEKRNDINQMISNHLKATGNNDLDNLLNQARVDWSTLQKTYYNENMNNAIVNMVNKKYRKIPTNLINVLQEESSPMQALRDFHPGLENALSKYQMKQNISSKFKKYGLPLALGAFGGYEGAKYGLSHR